MPNKELTNSNFSNSKKHTFNSKNTLSPYIEIISKDSEFFPKNLFILPDCPDIIFVICNKHILNTFSISIVGTRNSSPLGNELSYKFSKELSSNNITIVSGMASGIDTQAHLGGTSIAVIACGFNHIFIPKNIPLIKSILDSGGVIISEYFPDTPPQKYTFLNRNRLVAAISNATLIIEAPLKSGALNTAETAYMLKKPVFAIPWNISLKRGEGCNSLIGSKANILISTKQIIDFFKLHNSFDLKQKNNSANSNLKTSLTSHSRIQNNSSMLISIPKEYAELYKYIKENEPVNKNSICASFKHISVSSINSTLVLMELKSFIKLKRQ